MPRSPSSPSRSSWRPFSSVSVAKPSVSSVVPYTAPPPPTVVAPPMAAAPSFGQTLKEGFAFGTGSAFAHRIFGSGGGVAAPVAAAGAPELPKGTCKEYANYKTVLDECLERENYTSNCMYQIKQYHSCLNTRGGI